MASAPRRCTTSKTPMLSGSPIVHWSIGGCVCKRKRWSLFISLALMRSPNWPLLLSWEWVQSWCSMAQ